MAKTVNIFIAGAKDLAHQRQKLKAMISDLNHKNEDAHKGVRFNVSSYETFGNIQEVYNDFISNKADLVIFVLKDRIGPRTEEEYLLAIHTNKTKNRPKVVVFLNTYAKVTNDISYINGLLRGEDYYLSYKNDEDLVSNVKDYLADFIEKNTNKVSPRTYLKKTWVKVTVFFLLGALLSLVLLRNVSFGKEDKLLLIAGGGSAKNYIAKNKNVCLEDYPNSLYVHLPSEEAWVLLTEEAVSVQKEQKYIPICISASQAAEEDFTKAIGKERFSQKGKIIEVFLGPDTMSVLLKNVPIVRDKLDDECISKKKITIEQLAALLKEVPSLNVFATSTTSGTRRSYRTLFASVNVSLEKLNPLLFSEDSHVANLKMNGDVPCLFLGCRSYKVKDLKEHIAKGEVLELDVFEKKGNGEYDYAVKRNYLYFFAKDAGDQHLKVNSQVLKLLKDLKLDIDPYQKFKLKKTESNLKEGFATKTTDDSVLIININELKDSAEE